MVEEGYPLVEFQGNIWGVRALRVPRYVGFMTFDFTRTDVDEEESRNQIINMLSRVLSVSSSLTIGVFIHAGICSFYWFTKSISFDDPSVSGEMSALGAGNPVPILDPFGIMPGEGIAAKRIGKGLMKPKSSIFGHRVANSKFKRTDYNEDRYELFGVRPISDLLTALTRSFVLQSKLTIEGADFYHAARFYLTLTLRKVLASQGSDYTVNSTFKVFQPDPSKKLGINQKEAQEHRDVAAEFKRRFPGGLGIQFEAQAMAVYSDDITSNRAEIAVEMAVRQALTAVNAPSPDQMKETGKTMMPRAMVSAETIDFEDAVYYYLTGTFMKGKWEKMERVGNGEFTDAVDYFNKKHMMRTGDSVSKVVGTEMYNDRAVSFTDSSYLFPVFDRMFFEGLSISPDSGSLIYFPFYTSLYGMLNNGSAPSDLRPFDSMVEQKDYGYDARFLNTDSYSNFMKKINMPKFEEWKTGPIHGEDGKPKPLTSEPRNSGSEAKKSSQYSEFVNNNYGRQQAPPPSAQKAPVGDGALPSLKDGDVIKLYNDGVGVNDAMRVVRRFKGSDRPILGILKPISESGAITGPRLDPTDGFRMWVSAGSGSGKSTFAASIIVTAQAEGCSVLVPTFNDDIVNKVMKLLIDMYGTDSSVLDRVEFVMGGSNTKPSIYPLNLLHLAVPGMDSEGIVKLIQDAASVSRQAILSDSFVGTKIDSYFPPFTKAIHDVDPNSNLEDVLSCLSDPTGCKSALGTKSVASGAKRNSAIETAMKALDERIRNARSDEFASTQRFIESLTGSMFLRRMLNDRDASYDFSEFLRPDKPKIIFLFFPYPAVNESDAVRTAAVYIEMLYRWKLALNHSSSNVTFPNPKGGQDLTYRDSKLVVVADEFQKYYNDSLEEIVTQGRKEGVSIVLLTQDFRVKGPDGKPLYEKLKSNFNYKLFRDVRNGDDVKFFGLGDNSDVPRILSIFNVIHRREKGTFYWDAEGVTDHVVTDLYNISGSRPEFMEPLMDAVYKWYEFRDHQDGLERLRMLTDEDVEEMSASVIQDADFRRLCVLESLYLINDYYNNMVPSKDLETFTANMSSHANGIKVFFGNEGIKTERELFISYEKAAVGDALKYYLNNGMVRFNEGKKGGVHLYMITQSGINYLKESLGVGSSGGGEDHRDLQLKIAKAVVVGYLREMAKDATKGRAFAFLNINTRAGADLILSTLRSPL